MSERQKHGFEFQHWVAETFFESPSPTAYTSKWDGLSVVFKNQYHNYTTGFQGLPVSIKTCQAKKSLYFGDAIRQFENKDDFLLIIGFWQHQGNLKKFLSVEALRIDATQWHRYFLENEMTDGDLDADSFEKKLRAFDSTIKNIPSNIQGSELAQARELVKTRKKEFPFGAISLNQKIDSKDQRRLQCSMRFNFFWDNILGKTFSPLENSFWNERIPSL